MKWKPQSAESCETFWEAKTPLGDFVVDFSPWLRPNKPWCVIWYPVGTLSSEVTIGFRAGDKAGKLLAEKYLARIAAAARRAVA